ncbi:Phosphonate ABC transporter permease protein phnE2 [Candidatus Rhodobacter oscarellae]|uniref:Phosphonate ABC transporter permease protein phnE2 n=1 Tax=Candidatus Rhodobacter oscarellae TaxID=1675527 RepID=A0A0J9GW07_9RHOB|nr:phosphonate ABC transporter, permease protein PhnE [Candidatus Rhodobacter lobularis]KMW57748.1 Phosphonate ABC transporter permease protein phnE2 [Candidatus Rhodobacter lobularis]
MTAIGEPTVTPLRPLDQFELDYAGLRRRTKTMWLVASLIFLAAFTFSAWLGDFFKVTQFTLQDGSREWRWILPAGLPRLGEFIEKTFPVLRWESLGADLAEWFWRWRVWANLLIETILIAFMATALGVFGGFMLSFPAARNLAPNKWVLWISRRYLEIARTVPELVWALIFVFCFSVGPMAGVLAIGLHATGALGKLYSEVNENIDMRPLEGVKAAGGTWFDQIRYGAVPQVMPNIISYTLLRFEINVRASTIIGYVGAGGLGQEFREALSLQEYTDLSALFIIIFVTVMVIDYGSEKLRHRVIGMEKGPAA